MCRWSAGAYQRLKGLASTLHSNRVFVQDSCLARLVLPKRPKCQYPVVAQLDLPPGATGCICPCAEVRAWMRQCMMFFKARRETFFGNIVALRRLLHVHRTGLPKPVAQDRICFRASLRQLKRVMSFSEVKHNSLPAGTPEHVLTKPHMSPVQEVCLRAPELWIFEGDLCQAQSSLVLCGI